ncbi:MAG TPA: DUF5329 family protein [Phycisphaerae bacterium]|nr:DUF5329 family protein [Phycisphaerae bacterium]
MNRLNCTCLVGMLTALLVMQSPVLAGGYIQLQDVPESLWFPSREGSNLLLTASVIDAKATSVWLGIDDPKLGRVPLTRVGPIDYQVNLHSNEVFDLLKQAPARGEFRIFAETDGGEVLASIPVSFVVNVPPTRLSIDKKTTFTALQKRYAYLPGSRDRLRVYAGDITHGQITLSVFGRDRNVPLVPTTRLYETQHIVLPLDDETYVIEVEALHNYLMGDDYADLSIAPEAEWHRDKIEFMLNAIDQSEFTFIRNGKPFDGQSAAKHLRNKLATSPTPVTKVDAFIEDFASRSSMTDEPYKVLTADGRELELGQWLRSLLDGDIEATPKLEKSSESAEAVQQPQS